MNPRMRGLYQRGAIYWIAYKAGEKIVRESTGCGDRKLAEGLLAKRRTEVFEGRWLGRPRVRSPLHEAIQEYMKLYSMPRKISWRDDERILHRFETFVGSGVYVQNIRREGIERFLLSVLSSGASKSRVNRYTAAIKCFFNRCIDWGKLEANPCRGIRLYPEPPRTRWLEAGQVKTLLENCSDRLRPIVQVALLTGLRLGDILRLKWTQIHFEESLIRVVQSKTQTPLSLPISSTLANVLRAIPRGECPYVFQDGGLALPQHGWLRTDFQKAIKLAGFSGLRFHDLRHTAATQLRRLGRDLQVVQQLLGHKSIRMTLRYSHVHPLELRKAVDQLGEQIIPTRPGFTITSQSVPAFVEPILASSTNTALKHSESEFGKFGESAMPQTVNAGEEPSQDW